VTIVLPALDATGNTLGESPLSIEVVHSVAEPPTLLDPMGAVGAAPLVFFSRKAWNKKRTRPTKLREDSVNCL